MQLLRLSSHTTPFKIFILIYIYLYSYLLDLKLVKKSFNNNKQLSKTTLNFHNPKRQHFQEILMKRQGVYVG